jgi:hypothetical protein
MVGFGYNSSDHAAGDVLDSHRPSNRSTEGCSHVRETLQAIQHEGTGDELNEAVETLCCVLHIEILSIGYRNVYFTTLYQLLGVDCEHGRLTPGLHTIHNIQFNVKVI